MEGARNRIHHHHFFGSKMVMYVLSFLFSLHIALPVYINSSFLSGFVGENIVGILFSLASLCTILVFLFVPKVLERIGNYRFIYGLLVLDLLSLLGLAFLKNDFAVILFFIVNFCSTALINFSMDVFLEKLAQNNQIGRVRGLFLTGANISWIIAQIIMGYLVFTADFSMVYLSSALLVIPVLVIVQNRLGHFRDPHYIELSFSETLKEVVHDVDLRKNFLVSFFMHFFFAWMIIYSPIYLSETIGFSWEQLGILFAITLLPFLIMESFLGRYLDARQGEEGNIIAYGFTIMAMSTISLAILQTNTLWIWILFFFITRIGASMVEIGSETHFFRNIDPIRVNVMSFYRTMRPWAYCIGPLLSFPLLLIVNNDLRYIFLILGFFMILGINVSSNIKRKAE